MNEAVKSEGVVDSPYFTGIHEEVRKTVREVAREFRKKFHQTDSEGNYRIVMENLRRLGTLRLLGIRVPREYGGPGLDTRSYVITVEELAEACPATAFSYNAHTLAVDSILIGGNEEQKMKYLPLLAKGEKIGAFALSEPTAGSDAGSIKTTAELRGGKYILNGTKHFVTNGEIADIFVIFAKTDPSKRSKGISAFIVERETPGIKIGKPIEKMGMKASPVTPILLKNVEVPRENLLSGEGEGFRIAKLALNLGRIGAAALCIGIAKAALDIATQHAKRRVQFGQQIANFQAIQFAIADMATKIQAMESLTYHTAWLADQGQSITKEAAIAKLFASEEALKITDKAIQILGGMGYTRYYPAERYHRDVRAMTIAEGTSEIQRIIIAGSILRQR